jgi:hypothetical protein
MRRTDATTELELEHFRSDPTAFADEFLPLNDASRGV